MSKHVLDLTASGAAWQFKEYPETARRMRDLDGSDWFGCKVPNSIFINLVEAGVINRDDLYANPEKYEWVSDKPWVFRRTFEVSQEFSKSDKVELVCDGLDTLSNIWLNEKLISRTDNMFIQHRLDVTKFIKTGTNSLLIKFDPAVQYAKKQMERYKPFSEKIFMNPWRAYVRKAQYQFGWDFCPELPGCGIWRPIRLEGTTKARIANTHIRTVNCNENSADIRVAITLDSVGQQKLRCELDVYDPDESIVNHLEFQPHRDSGSAVLQIDNPRLWFPAGYGRPDLYRVRVNLLSGDEIIDTAIRSFGIRTVTLNQSKDRRGRKFEFELNNQKIYAKGANWVPASVFAGSVTRDDYEKLLTAAADANINMLRVWGGGYYEDDYFYELCDKFGIMVWQDFMFACCYYPDRQSFLNRINVEAHCVIERLYNHPCLVVFCGNNEIDWLHHQTNPGSGKKMYGKKIWHKLLPKIVAELDPDLPFIASTPHSVTKDPNNPNSGTVHNWDIWSEHKPVIDYITDADNIPRFVTEFGLQALPNHEAIKKLSGDENEPTIAAIEKHNYQVDGNSRLYRYLGETFGVVRNIEQFAYLTQLTQARGVKSYVEFLRANESNAGALFWQFNDVFPAISWSALDYSHTPKALYYYAKRFFSPILVAAVPQLDNSKAGHPPKLVSLGVVAVNDTAKPVTGKMICVLTNLNGDKIDKAEWPVALAPFSSSRPVHLPKAIAFPDNPEKSFLSIELQTHETVSAGNIYLYLPDKYIDWLQPDIKHEFIQTGTDQALLRLHSDTLAKDTRIETVDKIKLSENYIDVLPDSPKTIEVKLDRPIEEIEPYIKITSVASALTD